MNTFLYAPTFCMTCNTQLIYDDFQIRFVHVDTFLTIFGARIILSYILLKWRFSELFDDHIVAPPKKIRWIGVASRMVKFFWTHTPICFEHMSLWCPFLDPHSTIQRSNVGVHLRRGSKLGTSKVETPYHDNDLILTPIISSQSGWQRTWSCMELHMGSFRDGGWQILIFGRCHKMELSIFNTYMNFSRHHVCCFTVVPLFVLDKFMA